MCVNFYYIIAYILINKLKGKKFCDFIFNETTKEAH